MGYEIDVLGINEQANCGEAIVLRYGKLQGRRNEQVVVVIDGGCTCCGQGVVDHVRTRFQTEKVDVVISTGLDQGHLDGLAVVVDQMEVGQLWVHQPWRHNLYLADVFAHGRVTDSRVGVALRAALESVYWLVEQAQKKGVVVVEPFVGHRFGWLKVVGPTREGYEAQVTAFNGMPNFVGGQKAPSWLKGFVSAIGPADDGLTAKIKRR